MAIEVKREFLTEYREIRAMLWKAGDLLDSLGLALAEKHAVWPPRLRTKYERLRAAIARKQKEWESRGTRD